MNAAVTATHLEWALPPPDGSTKLHGSAPDLTLTCAYSPKDFEFMPRMIEKMGRRYRVDGYLGNRLNGSGTCWSKSTCRASMIKCYRRFGLTETSL